MDKKLKYSEEELLNIQESSKQQGRLKEREKWVTRTLVFVFILIIVSFIAYGIYHYEHQSQFERCTDFENTNTEATKDCSLLLGK
jgi:uncharacterized membrane protein